MIDISASPFHDDYDQTKRYYQVLFKPGVDVQARELNQLQSMLQKQVARFGDAVYRSGTVVDGCSFSFFDAYPYVKLRDLEVETRSAVDTSTYVGKFAYSNNSGLRARVVNSADGFEVTDPDLATIYVSYNNAGEDTNTHAFVAGEVLTIYDPELIVEGVDVENGGAGFVNTDTIVLTSTLAVDVSTGTFEVGDFVTQPSIASNLEITAINEDLYATDGYVVLTLEPRNVDMANAAAPSTNWAVANGVGIRNSDNSAIGTVMLVLGEGATAALTTDGVGRVSTIRIVTSGEGYVLAPTARVRSPNNAAGMSSLDLRPRTWLAYVRVANTEDAVGFGYAFGVNEGVSYQDGYFLRVETQTIIVERYDTSPNNVSVGFTLESDFIDADEDTSLLDNATGAPNYGAPGADRLKLTPTLELVTGVDNGNSVFLPLVSWSEGRAFRQNQKTEFTRLGDEMARRTHESGGDFVLDRFLVSTRSVANSALEAAKMSIIIDPGTAYIAGRRVSTERNFALDVDKGHDTTIRENERVSLSYGAYVRVKEMGGYFVFKEAANVQLYDTAKSFLSTSSNVEAGNISPSAASIQIGSARLRMIDPEPGATPGHANAVYRFYLFDIQMSSGKNFGATRAIQYGANLGIVDVLLELDPSSNASIAKLHEPAASRLVFPLAGDGVKNINAISYRYRTLTTTLSIANTGIGALSISGNPDETFPFSPNLTMAQLASLVLVPTVTTLIASANIAGTASINTTSNLVTGSSTTFVTDLAAGDWVRIANTGSSTVRRVETVINNTSVALDSNAGFIDAGCSVRRIFPKHVPVPLGTRAGLIGNLNGSSDLLTIDLGFALSGSVAQTAMLVYDAERTDATVGAKTAVRTRYVKIYCSNSAGTITGPWSLGASDAIRLRHVYLSTASTVNVNSSDVTADFYVDAGQSQDYVDLAWLYQKPRPGTRLTSANWLLAEIDVLSAAAGPLTAMTYASSDWATRQTVDSANLASLVGQINTWEVPCVETRGVQGYLPLLCAVDFRPRVVNTASISTTTAGAPVNPLGTVEFGNTSGVDFKFPAPGSVLTATVEYFMGRTDTVYASEDGGVQIVKGIPALDPAKRAAPRAPQGQGIMRLNDVRVPSYPTLPTIPSRIVAEILQTRITQNGGSSQEAKNKRAATTMSDNAIDLEQPMRRTHRNVGALERRVAALEYYSSLSAAQTDMASLRIPSSIDPALDRFKLGFFIDPFDSYIGSNKGSPCYAAFVTAGRLWPPLYVWHARARGGAITAPWQDEQIIAQTFVSSNTSIDDDDDDDIPIIVIDPPPPVIEGTLRVVSYDYMAAMAAMTTSTSYTATSTPYVGVNNPTIWTLPPSGWRGSTVGCHMAGMRPSTQYDFLWNNTVRNDLVTLPGQGLNADRPVLGSRPITDTSGQGYFAAYFNETTQEYADILNTFYMSTIGYGYRSYEADLSLIGPGWGGGTTTTVASNFTDVYALGRSDGYQNILYHNYQPRADIHSSTYIEGGDNAGSMQNNTTENWLIPGAHLAHWGMPMTLKYNILKIEAPNSRATTTVPIWTSGILIQGNR